MVIHSIFPSSNIPQEQIDEFGWRLVEPVPGVVNAVGRLAPTPDRSELHRALRAKLEEHGSATYQTASGDQVEIRDFALAHTDDPSGKRQIGFFALQ